MVAMKPEEREAFVNKKAADRAEIQKHIQTLSRARDEAALCERAQNAAEVTGVEAEVAAQLRSGRRGSVGKLVEHAGFGERKLGFEQAVAQHAHPSGVEAREPSHRCDALFRDGPR